MWHLISYLAAMNWLEACQNPHLKDLPFKVELNSRGKIEMSPHKNNHALFQGRIIRLLSKLMPDGEAFPECPIETSDNVKVADVVWVSPGKLLKIQDQAACSEAPEICVEIMSMSNTLDELAAKRLLYFAAGAEEVWLCDEQGRMRYFGRDGELPASRRCPPFPRVISWRQE
jgi:Uma2 family endonuclease